MADSMATTSSLGMTCQKNWRCVDQSARIVANAPAHEEHFFVVPKVVE